MKIEQKITGYSVAEQEQPQRLHEQMPRPETLQGTTYKIKTPTSDHALYLTINDIVHPDGHRQPFEIFINSKCMEQFQWIVALTRVMSAVFRKGGEVAFLVDELRSVFDPRGGYFKKGGQYMPSLVAEIGAALQHHLGLMEEAPAQAPAPAANRPKGKQCPHCKDFALVKEGGCEKCHNCGEAGECG